MAAATRFTVAMTCLLLVASSSSDCSSNDQDDVTSLLQKEQTVKHSRLDAADRSALDDLARTRFRGNRTAAWEGGFYGRTAKDAGGSTCFLSKKSLFTCPYQYCKDSLTEDNRQTPGGCSTVDGLQQTEHANVNGDNCKLCIKEMSKLPESFYHGKPAACESCNSAWFRRCTVDQRDWDVPNLPDMNFAQGFGTLGEMGWVFGAKVSQDEVFKAQEDFMVVIAKKLNEHGTHLYLDFEDPAADDLVTLYGGRDVAFSNKKFYASMLNVLQDRAKESDNFLHWVGASGDFCLAEQSGRHVRGKWDEKPFNFPPLVTLQKDSGALHSTAADYANAVCQTTAGAGYTSSFLGYLCHACGGERCEQICPQPTGMAHLG